MILNIGSYCYLLIARSIWWSIPHPPTPPHTIPLSTHLFSSPKRPHLQTQIYEYILDKSYQIYFLKWIIHYNISVAPKIVHCLALFSLMLLSLVNIDFRMLPKGMLIPHKSKWKIPYPNASVRFLGPYFPVYPYVMYTELIRL